MSDQFTISSIGWIGALSIVLTVALVTISSLLDIARAVGLRWPRWLFEAIEQREAERFRRFLDQSDLRTASNAKIWVDRVFQAEEGYVRAHQEFLLGQIIHHFGIPRSDFVSICENIRQLRHAPRKSSEEVERVLMDLCHRPPILIDTSTLRDPLYREVRFYLNFVDAMADKNRGDILVDLMANHIRCHLGTEELDRLVVVTSANGNVTLGIETARALRRPFLLMREKPRVEQGQYWDGSPPHGSVLILVHDVAVSGDQLVSAHDSLEAKGHSCKRVFCLVERTDKAACVRLQQRSMTLIPILQLDDALLANRP